MSTTKRSDAIGPLARLHHALMPDYNPRATAFWWSAIVGGAAVLAVALAALSGQAWTAWLQTAAAMLLALLAGLFPMRVPRSKNSFVAGEIFIFLLLLVQGPAAATVAAAGEAFVASCRTSKRWTSRLVSPAIASISMTVAGTGLSWVLASLQAVGRDDAATLLACAMAFSALYFLLTALGVSGVPRLKRGEPFFQIASLLSVFRWVGIAFAGSASMASLLFVAYRQSGASVLMVMLPLVGMLLVTLHFYFRQQEAAESARDVNAEMAAREAAMSARATAVAEQHLRELQASEQRFHAAFTHASIGMALMAFDGRLLQVNPAMCALLGADPQALLASRIQALVVEDDQPLLSTQLGLAAEDDFEGFHCELRCHHRDGSVVWLDVHCGFFTEPGASLPCLILQAQNVTARRAAEDGLQHLAFHDSLTGLANRRRFLECLTGAVERARVEHAHTYSVMFLDFDRFKLVNDSLGHNAGDELLIQMARRIQENLRPGDIVARLGGDEFAVLIERAERERDTIVLAERLMEALKRPFQLGAIEIVASASIGITFSAFGYESAEEVLRDADTAMYRAKAQGRAGYALFDTALHTAVSDRLRLEGELRQAIDHRQLTVAYQPLFDLVKGRLIGFEALVRWNHPVHGMLDPMAFLPMAEETGLMLQLSDFVLHCACQQLRQWQISSPAHGALTMSVNVSANDLSNPAFVAQVGRALVEAHLSPAHLTLELTENILMSSIVGARDTLDRLRDLGVQLAVDDFGTGYSSLSQLARLPINSLKIDRSFIGQLRSGPNEMAVVQAIIELGRTLQKTVVAEGIESADQMSMLRDMGCVQGQGFHLATPMTAQAVGDLLRDGTHLH
ncbi:MAG: EAL domain-containing protein [Ideonella sp.]|nr:EAL domain-containing protein [Ideonella sp.]